MYFILKDRDNYYIILNFYINQSSGWRRSIKKAIDHFGESNTNSWSIKRCKTDEDRIEIINLRAKHQIIGIIPTLSRNIEEEYPEFFI